MPAAIESGRPGQARTEAGRARPAMMRQYELVERVLAYDRTANEALLNRAYVYAMQKHGSQKRESGDPYFSHPLEVAGILTDLRLDDATIAVALLHDVIEDTDATRQEIDSLFGGEIGKLVDGLTKIGRLDLVPTETKKAENFRKLLLAVADDVRVLLVKLADRLHNMRTIKYMRPEKRVAIAQETMDIYAPLAGRIGMQAVRDELEELAFAVLEPEAFGFIRLRLEAMREGNARLIHDIETALSERLAERGIDAQVSGREKRPYSIFLKMQRKAISFEQLSDIYGFRVVVSDIECCYRVLGLIHTAWPSVPGRFKDYISTPKQNDYRSLHTTVVGPSRQRVELQIRTPAMHQIAEYGIAAHALYKEADGGRRTLATLDKDSRAYAWLRRTIELLSQGNSPEEFLEHTKLELFHDQVFCFTPKGKLIALPRGATPIDFAYAVHTDIGNTCTGCKINGHLRPIATQLENGDEVEVLCSPQQTPSPVWETIAVTGKARAAIRRATREAARRQYIALGRHMVESRFGPINGAAPAIAAQAAAAAGMPNADEFFAGIGRGTIDLRKALAEVDPRFADPSDTAEADESAGAGAGLAIDGLAATIPVRFAVESGAVPGDRIVGILMPGQGVTIYPIQSPALQKFENEPDRWIDVRWAKDRPEGTRFPAQIQVSGANTPGTLVQIAQSIADGGANIDNIQMVRQSADFHELRIGLEVFDLKHLNAILRDLRGRPVVAEAVRVGA